MSDRLLRTQETRSDLCFRRLIRTKCCPAARHLSGSSGRAIAATAPQVPFPNCKDSFRPFHGALRPRSGPSSSPPGSVTATGPLARSIVAHQGEIRLPIVGMGPADGHLDGAERIPLLVPVQTEPEARREVDVGDVVFPAQDVR